MADTIYAVSSGAPPSAVAIVRLSGPASASVIETLTRRPLPPSRQAVLRRLLDADGAVIDHAVVIRFSAPGSFTGEDVAELHVHGSRAVVAKLARTLSALPGLRPAEAGEFTRIAFLNGRMDLTEVEALADLIGSETEEQRRAAITQGEGGLRARCDGWRERLIHARAWVEAAIDFTDEADVPADISGRAWEDVAALAREIAEELATAVPAERVRDGLVVVLTGAPNAGKSSLLNALVGRDAAIVSDEPGTTRDLIEVDLDLDGFAVRLIDTAGLHEAAGAVEREGIRRARARASRADLVLHLMAADEPETVPPEEAAEVWRVWTKADLVDSERQRYLAAGGWCVSIHDPVSLQDLARSLAETARSRAYGPMRGLILQQRQRGLLDRCRLHLEAAIAQREIVDLAGEELRLAGHALGGITGDIGTEDVLGRIFQQFCIGK